MWNPAAQTRRHLGADRHKRTDHFFIVGHEIQYIGINAMTKTDNPLDVAIGGDGYFAIQKDGRTVYTRNGQFIQDQLGNLVTMQGHQVLSAGLGPLNIPEDAQISLLNESASSNSE